MWEDPIVAEVRRARQQLWEECGREGSVLWQRLRKQSAAHPERMATPADIQRMRSAGESVKPPACREASTAAVSEP